MPNPKTITEEEKDIWYQKTKRFFGKWFYDSKYDCSMILDRTGKHLLKHEIIFKENEIVVVKDQSFTVKYLSKHCMMLEPLELQIINTKE